MEGDAEMVTVFVASSFQYCNLHTDRSTAQLEVETYRRILISPSVAKPHYCKAIMACALKTTE